MLQQIRLELAEAGRRNDPPMKSSEKDKELTPDQPQSTDKIRVQPQAVAHCSIQEEVVEGTVMGWMLWVIKGLCYTQKQHKARGPKLTQWCLRLVIK